MREFRTARAETKAARPIAFIDVRDICRSARARAFSHVIGGGDGVLFRHCRC